MEKIREDKLGADTHTGTPRIANMAMGGRVPCISALKVPFHLPSLIPYSDAGLLSLCLHYFFS